MGNNVLDKNSIVIAARTPQQLDQILMQKMRTEILMGRNIILVLDDKRYRLKKFETPALSGQECRQFLENKSMEFLNLRSGEIVMDFQIMLKNDGKMKGVFACVPAGVVEEYIQVIEKYSLHVLKIVPGMLVRLENLIAKKTVSDIRFVYVDLSRNKEMDIVIMSGGSVELLRNCPFDNEEQALKEIDRSLKSVCSQSARKTWDKIYAVGQGAETSKLIRKIETHFNDQVEVTDGKTLNTEDGCADDMFSINLTRNLCLHPHTKKVIGRCLNIGLAVLFVCIVFYTVKGFTQKHALNFWEKATVQAKSKI